MAAGLDNQRLSAVFQSRPDILEGIHQAADSPARIKLFNNIATFVHDQISGPEPAAKRRRIDDGLPNRGPAASANGTATLAERPGSAAEEEQVQLVIKEISVSVPQRKKYDLCFTDKHLYARAPGTSAPVQGISYTWADIEYAFYLPVPEKAQVQHNYVLFPRGTAFPSKTDPPAIEPLVFTVPSTAPKHGTVEGPKAGAAAALSDTYRALFDWALTIHLSAASNPTTIVAADPAKFHSVARQAHRPNEKAVHIKAFRGSKDGYIFFLPNGILWGFKKPLLFMPLERIAAVSYTSVLQRTFNVVVEVFTGEGDVTEEVEFSMLDQEDYQGIDELYVKRNRLQDRSMAEQRRAKMELLENQRGKKGDENGAAAAANGGVGPDGMTELERAHAEAEQEMQDEEDEDEEDYDPGSEGESEGEGETSEEEDEDGEGEEGDEEEEEEEDGDQDGEGDLDTA